MNTSHPLPISPPFASSFLRRIHLKAIILTVCTIVHAAPFLYPTECFSAEVNEKINAYQSSIPPVDKGDNTVDILLAPIDDILEAGKILTDEYTNCASDGSTVKVQGSDDIEKFIKRATLNNAFLGPSIVKWRALLETPSS